MFRPWIFGICFASVESSVSPFVAKGCELLRSRRQIESPLRNVPTEPTVPIVHVQLCPTDQQESTRRLSDKARHRFPAGNKGSHLLRVSSSSSSSFGFVVPPTQDFAAFPAQRSPAEAAAAVYLHKTFIF